MLTKEEQAREKEWIIATLRESQRYNINDILNRHPGEERTIRLLVWEAREELRLSDGIVFGPLRGRAFEFERKDWSQIERQANSQRAAGTRKHKRAEQKLRLASTQAPDQSRERLSEAADRVALRLAMRAART